MRKIKILLFTFILLFLSGCSVEYNLTINEDNTISEKVVATEKTKRLESLTNLKDKQAVMYLYDIFKRENEDISFSHRSDNTLTYANAFTSHNNIDEYADKFTSDIFKNVNVQRNKNIVDFTAKQSKVLKDNSSHSLIYDDIKINIQIPYKVIENNADSVKGNIYTWNINKSKDLKTIKIKYDESNKKGNVNVKINNKTYNIKYGIVVIGVMGVIIVSIVIFVCIKNKKNNVV